MSEHNARAAMEVLAPGGDMDSLRAAVSNGADAVYFGLSQFNARHRAGNGSGESLQERVRYLHDHNVRAYVAFNTLIFPEELEQAEQAIVEIAQSGADAVIVQDLGLARLIHEMAPSLPIHASTQMTLSDVRAIEFARSLGVCRVILPRELSIADIAAITRATDMPVEVFVHGALCVSYSGQCLTSESIGGRSANRGQCAQACRLPYELVVDGKRVDTRGRAYLLSPQDLAAFDRVGELQRAGVAAIKIEGRLKSAAYVAATTAAYRSAVDAAAAGRAFSLPPRQQEQLTQSFSRGFTHGFLDGVNHQQLVPATFSKKRGAQVGVVVAASVESVLVRLSPGQTLRAGDGVVFDEGHPEQDEQGGRIFTAKPAGAGLLQLAFMRGAVRCETVAKRALVWKTDDPRIARELSQTFNRDTVVKRERLDAVFFAREGRPLRVTLRDARGTQVSCEAPSVLEAAIKHPLTPESLREQFGRLGSTPFELGEVRLCGETEAHKPGAVMAPKSVLNELRRSAVDALQAVRLKRERHEVVSGDVLARRRCEIRIAAGAAGTRASSPALAVLARSMSQLEAALHWCDGQRRVAMVYAEFEDVRQYPAAVSAARQQGTPIALATLRIVKPGEEGLLKSLEAAAPDAVLARTLGALEYFRGRLPLIGDYSLNVANELTAQLLLESGCERVCASHDLNWPQLAAVLSRMAPARVEVVVHQQMPMFHMEHCVFAAMLSNGRDHRECGRPCEKHRLALRDRRGVEHPVVADVGCRNTVYNGRAQALGAYVQRMLAAGVCWYRVELLGEDAAGVGRLLDYYSQALAAAAAGPLKLGLPVLGHFGVTPGTLEFD